MTKTKKIDLAYSLFFTLIIGVISWETGLFWDNILFVQKMSAPLFEKGFWSWGQLPLECDPGHPPFIATYMSIVWSIFGRSLYVSHIVLYPFIFMFIFNIIRIAKLTFHNSKIGIVTAILVLADPTILTSLVYIGTEIFILSFASLAIYGIISGNKYYKILGMMFLAITSLRGMMLCGGIFLWEVMTKLIVKRCIVKQLFNGSFLTPYIIAALPSFVFIIWRLVYKGWIISNPLSPWGNAFGYTDIFDFITNFARNILVLLQRITDFGRIIIIGLIGMLIWFFRNNIKSNSRLITIILFILCCCSFIVSTSLIIKNPMGHNYFSLIYLGLIFLLVELIRNIKWRRLVYTMSLCVLLLSNFIVYPETISQGWNASLASLPYWQLRKEILLYIEEQNIPLNQVFFSFPFGSCADDVELNNDKRSYATNIDTAEYFVLSNICNFNNEILMQMKQYPCLFYAEKRGVYVSLHKR